MWIIIIIIILITLMNMNTNNTTTNNNIINENFDASRDIEDIKNFYNTTDLSTDKLDATQNLKTNTLTTNKMIVNNTDIYDTIDTNKLASTTGVFNKLIVNDIDIIDRLNQIYDKVEEYKTKNYKIFAKEDNIGYWYHELYNLPTKSYDECRKICRDNGQCYAFSRNKNNTKCYLKYARGNDIRSSNDIESGYVK